MNCQGRDFCVRLLRFGSFVVLIPVRTGICRLYAIIDQAGIFVFVGGGPEPSPSARVVVTFSDSYRSPPFEAVAGEASGRVPMVVNPLY